MQYTDSVACPFTVALSRRAPRTRDPYAVPPAPREPDASRWRRKAFRLSPACTGDRPTSDRGRMPIRPFVGNSCTLPRSAPKRPASSSSSPISPSSTTSSARVDCTRRCTCARLRTSEVPAAPSSSPVRSTDRAGAAPSRSAPADAGAAASPAAEAAPRPSSAQRLSSDASLRWHCRRERSLPTSTRAASAPLERSSAEMLLAIGWSSVFGLTATSSPSGATAAAVSSAADLRLPCSRRSSWSGASDGWRRRTCSTSAAAAAPSHVYDSPRSPFSRSSRPRTAAASWHGEWRCKKSAMRKYSSCSAVGMVRSR